MSDLRARLAEALRKHRQGPGPSCRCCGVDYDAPTYTDHLADALLSLDGIAIVELPEQVEERSCVVESLRGQPMWSINDAWASIGGEDEIELEADRQMLSGALKSAQDARDLAAVLLAAANAAEIA